MPAAGAATLTGTVTHVADGDTLTLRARSQQVKVRLVNIDAPETDQPWGFQSRRRLEALVRLEPVRVRTRGRDKYERVLGEVVRVRDGLDINLELVRQGMAWAYTRGQARSRFEEAERAARAGRIGLWQDEAPIRPGNWRRRQRAADDQDVEAQTFFIQAASRESGAGLKKSQPPGAMP